MTSLELFFHFLCITTFVFSVLYVHIESYENEISRQLNLISQEEANNLTFYTFSPYR